MAFDYGHKLITLSSYDDIRENRAVEAVWQSDICHICCIDFGDIIACILQPICDPDVCSAETGQYSDNPVSVYSVHLEFDKLQVLQSAFITAQTGRVTGVLGRNGCGKSCLFKCIMGGIKPQNIFVRFNDSSRPTKLQKESSSLTICTNRSWI